MTRRRTGGSQKLFVSFGELRDLLEVPPPNWPTYVAPLLNLANRYAGATRPRVVGQMSALMDEFQGRTLDEWAAWYQERHPQAIQRACELIRKKLEEFKGVLDSITDAMIRAWVEDLLLAKTFLGLRYQEAILKAVATCLGVPYRLASPAQEARGVDGVVGGTEVSIKPRSWQGQVIEREALEGVLIPYEKKDKGLEIEFDPSQFCRE